MFGKGATGHTTTMPKQPKVKKTRSPETLALLVAHRGGRHKAATDYTRKVKHKGRMEE